MRKATIILLLIALFVVSTNLLAQHRNFISNNYVYHLFLVNPADAGASSNCVRLGAFYEKQWFGTDLAPTTQLIAVQLPLALNLGSGTYIYNDRNATMQKMGLQQSVSITIKLKESRRGKSTLSFGLSALMEQASLDESYFNQKSNVSDPQVLGGIESGLGVDMNVGAILRIKRFETGIAATNLIPQQNKIYNMDFEQQRPIDYHFHASKNFKVKKRELYFEPMAYFRINSYNDRKLDLNLSYFIPTSSENLALWGLFSYRHTLDHAVGKSLGLAATFGIKTYNLSVGLEYQLGLTGAQTHYGSYTTLVLGYKFCKDRSKDPTPCEQTHKKRNKRTLYWKN